MINTPKKRSGIGAARGFFCPLAGDAVARKKAVAKTCSTSAQLLDVFPVSLLQRVSHTEKDEQKGQNVKSQLFAETSTWLARPDKEPDEIGDLLVVFGW